MLIEYIFDRFFTVMNICYFFRTKPYTAEQIHLIQSVEAKGPSAYRFLRKKLDNKIAAPSTLKNHQEFSFIGPGEVPGFRDILRIFVRSLSEIQRKIMVYFDEMSVSPRLSYDKRGDRVIGEYFKIMNLKSLSV